MKSIMTLSISLLMFLSCNTRISQPAEIDPYEKWKSKNIHNYVIEQKRICYCPNSDEIARITVRSDTIISVTRVLDDSVITNPYYLSINFLFGIIKSNNYDSIVVRYNEEYGYPEYLDIAPQQHPVDGGFSYETSLKEFEITLNKS
jgi:hypothetical protein